MRTRAARLALAFIAVLASPMLAWPEEKSPADRTSPYKTCADLFAALVRPIKRNEEFDKLGVNPHKIPEGGVFISKTGKVIVRPFGATDPDAANIVEASEAAKAVAEVVKQAESKDREVVISGDVPLDRLLDRVKGMGLKEGEQRVLLSLDPTSPIAKAKQRLLEKNFKRVEIIVDVNVPSSQVQNALQATLDHAIPLPGDEGAVHYIALKDLPGDGSLADRLLAARPPPDTLRITVTHHRAGVAYLSDGSSLALSNLSVKRIGDGDMDVYIGCNLMYEKAGWLVIDGEVLGKEIAGLGDAIANLFRDGQPHSGRDILGQTTSLDVGQTDGQDNGKANGAGKAARASFRLLEIVALGFALGYANKAKAAGLCDDDDKKDKTGDKKCKGGFVPLQVEHDASLLRVGGQTPWFKGVKTAEQTRGLIFPRVLDRPVLLLDTSGKRVLFFDPARQSAEDLPEPTLEVPLDGALTPEQTAKLKELAPRFWFYCGTEQHPVRAREQLLQWQERTKVTLPFIFLVEGTEPTSASWTLLKPFLSNVTLAGECIPRTQHEANDSGLFWCSAHDTEAHLKQYSDLVDTLGEKGTTKMIDLRKDSGKGLAEMLGDSDSNAWLVGVWVDGGLRRPDGLLPNAKWVDGSACHARIAFVSAYPVSAPPKGRYFENGSYDLIPKSLVELRAAAKEDKIFPEVKGSLEAFYKALQARGGIIAVSSCGKYLLISE